MKPLYVPEWMEPYRDLIDTRYKRWSVEDCINEVHGGPTSLFVATQMNLLYRMRDAGALKTPKKKKRVQ